MDPYRFFAKGEPLPPCKLPSGRLLEYYSTAAHRGYLCGSEQLSVARAALAQKYGYLPPDRPADELRAHEKGVRQIFYGLLPGWIVCLPDRRILKPTRPEVLQYYQDQQTPA